MRTVTQTFLKRLMAQSEEAETQGFPKIASHLTEQVEKNVNVRSDDASYTYPESDLEKDVEGALWSAAVRVADFHNLYIDAKAIHELIERYADNFISELRTKSGIEHGVGAYEPTTPGEMTERAVISVEEDE